MKVNAELIQKVSRNARINLSEKEADKFVKDFQEILEAFSKIQKAPCSNEPSVHPFVIKDVLRKDEVKQGLSIDEALSNAVHKKDNYFKGPRAL